MRARPICLALAILLAVTSPGCTLLDRESYSLMIRKPAHKYEPTPPPPAPEPLPVEPVLVSASAISPAGPSSWVRRDLDALIEGVAPTLEPFRPFTYCHLHESSHVLESAVAVVVAPIEYPLALATTVCSYEKQIGLFWIPGEPVLSIIVISTVLLWQVMRMLLAPPDPTPEAPEVPTR